MIKNYPCPGILSPSDKGPSKHTEISNSSTPFSIRKRLKNFFFAMVMLLPFAANATHIVGGALTYVYNGADSYTVSLVLYRDCGVGNTAYPANMPITVLQADGTPFVPSRNFTLLPGAITPIPPTLPPCATMPSPAPCAEERTYSLTVTLPAADGGMHLYASLCCRNGSVVNITTPGAVGETFYAFIPNHKDVWKEYFTLPNATTVDVGSTAWSRTINGTAPLPTAQVNGNLFEVISQNSATTTNVVWSSQIINIAAFLSGVNIDLDITDPVGNQLQNGDSIKVFYSLNGGPQVLFPTNGMRANDFDATLRANAPGLIGNTVQIFVRVVYSANSANTEIYRFDRAVVYDAAFMVNNTPVFSAVPPLLFCATNPFSFSQAATDADGDSLAYSMYTPYIDVVPTFTDDVASFTPATWVVGFSAITPFNNGGPNVTLSPTTGLLTGVANSLGKYVFGIKCREYRNSRLVSEVVRDYEVNTVTCPPFVPPAPTVGSNSPLCVGNTLNLTASNIPGATYSWVGPNAFTSLIQNPSIVNVTLLAAGTYSVYATVAGCTGPAGTGLIVVNPTPAAPVAGSNSPICVGSTLNLTASNVPGATYAWTGPNSFSSALQNPSIVNATAAASGTYSVTVTVSGCTSPPATVVVLVSPVPPAPTAGSNSPLCVGATLNLTASTVPGATYAWTGPNAFSSALQNPSIVGVTLAAAGTYSVTATVGGCTGPAGTVVVVVNPIPSAPVAGSNSPICAGSTLNLTASTIPGATYAWTGPNSFSSALQNPSIVNATIAAAGTYSVTATVGGCTSPVATVTVVVNPTPVAPTAGSNSPICAGSTLNLTASFIPGATYAWTGPNSFSSALQNPSIANATVAASGTYSVTATVGGCTGPVGTVIVVVNPTPPAPVANSNSPICVGQTLNLTASTIPGATYAWTGPNAFSSALQNPSIVNATLLAAGTYSVHVTVAGCTGPNATVVVVVNPLPAAPVAGSNSPVCVGSTLNLTASTIPGATYSWVGPNSFTSLTQNPSIVNVTLPAAGTYTVYAISAAGCVGPGGTVTVVVNPVPIAPTAGSNSPLCVGMTLNLTCNNVPGATYAWTGPNSFSSALQNPSIVNVAVANAGTYSVTVTVNGCTSPVGTVVVTINSAPALPILGSNSPLCTGQTLNLTSNFVLGATYAWTGPNSFTSTLQNPSIPNITLAGAGTYSLVINNGCASPQATITIVVNPTPAAPVLSSNSPVCLGNTLNLFSNLVPGATYAWTGPNSFSSALQNPSIVGVTLAAAGTYSLVITSAAGCASPQSTITVIIGSPAVVNAGPDVTVCANNISPIPLSGTSSTGAGHWTSTGTGTFAPNTNTLNATYTPSAADILAGTVTLTLTSLNNAGCNPVADQLVITISPAPIVNAGPDQTVCGNNANVTLNGTFSNCTGIIWSTSGTGIFSPNNTTTNATYIPSSADTAAGTVTITITSTGNGTCLAVTDQMIITITNAPVVSAGAATDSACANNPNITLNGSSSTGTGIWSTSGTGTFSPNNTTLNATYIPSAADILAGTVTLTLTSTTNGNCLAVTSTIILIYTAPPTVNANVDQTVCGNNANVLLNGISSTGSGHWSSSGTGTFSPNSNTLNATYIPSAADTAAGTVTLTLTTLNNGGCLAVTDQMTITITNAPIANAGPDQSVCANNANTTLNGSVAVASGGTWSTSGTGTFSPNNTNMNTTYIPSSADTLAGTVTIVLTTTGNGNCNPATDTMIITITNAPVVSAGANVIQCKSSPNTTLNGSSSTGSGHWTTSGCGFFTPNSNTSNAVYHPCTADTTAGSVTLTFTSTANGGCNAVVSTMTITYQNTPSVNAGSNQTVCANNAVITLNGTSSTGTGIWSTSGTGTFSPNNTTLNGTYTASAADTAAGTVTLTLTSTNGCTPISQTITITITNAPVVNAGPDQTVCKNNPNVNLSGIVYGGATTGIWSSTGTGTFTPNNTNLNTSYIPSTADTAAGFVYIILTSTGNGNCLAVVDTMKITYTTPPVAMAGPDQVTCANNPVQLNGIILYGNGTGVWSTTNGTGTFNPNTNTLNATYTPSNADTLTGTIILILTSTNNGGCLASSDTVLINVTPGPIVNAGPDQTVCANNGATNLVGTIVHATGGIWTSNGTGTFNPNNTSLNTTYIPSAADTAAGTVTIYLTSTGNGLCSAVMDSMVITITDAPNVNAGNDIYICQGSITAQLNGSVTGGSSTGTWTTLGTGFFTPNANTLNAIYHLSTADTTAGIVYLILTSTGNGNCLAEDDTVAIHITSIPVTTAGTDTTLCANNATYQLNGSVVGGSGTGIWTTSGTGTFTPSDTSLNATYTPSAADIANGSVTITLTATNACIPVADFLVITFTPAPIVNAGPDQTVCAGTNINLTGTITVASGGIWSTSGDGTFNPNNTSLNTTYIPGPNDLVVGVDTIILTSTGNGNCFAVNDTMILIIQAKPVADFVHTPSCLGVPIQFTDTSTGAVSVWSWNFGNGTSTLQDPTNTFNTTGPQTITLIVSTSAGCADTITKNIFVNPNPLASWTGTSYCPDSAMFLGTGTIPSGGIIGWAWNFGDTTGSALQNPNHTYQDSGSYVVTLTITSDSGCVASYTDTITVDNCVDNPIWDPILPQAFTPNGDGHNDVLYVKGGPFAAFDFRIFNEWGNEIYHGTDQAQGWDGTYRSKMQPGGTYVWTINVTTLDNRVIKNAGDVTMIR